jgi:DAK2 domain fusion protein YloV
LNTTKPPPTAPRSRLDGDGLLGMFLSALHLLERNVDKINALNVFPVPDGDTGTNMYLTLRSVVEDSRPLQGASSAAVSRKMADVALMEAKGNSGVILSQFFRGLAIGLEGTEDFGCLELAQSLAEGRKLAYTAIGNPVEGTILTVMTSVAEAADAMDSSAAQLNEMLDAICSGAREAVALTPTMLPVLMQAGVVDAGGQGLSVILEGVRRYVDGSSPVGEEMDLPAPVGIDGHAGSVSHEFLVATDEEQYGYCTQLLVEGEELDPASIRETVSSLGVSVVVVGTESTVRVHVHVADPGPVLSAAVALGVVSQIKIENMDSQHVEFSAAHRQDPVVEPLESAVVTVVLGKGFEAVVNSLGVSEIVQGGDTMNPSVKDLLEAVGRAPSEQVILLPNNRNNIPAARQAANLSDKSVTVVASEKSN